MRLLRSEDSGGVRVPGLARRGSIASKVEKVHSFSRRTVGGAVPMESGRYNFFPPPKAKGSGALPKSGAYISGQTIHVNGTAGRR